jgi:hypothetical protein
MTDISEILRQNVFEGELKNASNDLLERCMDVIGVHPELDLIEAAVLLIEELDIEEKDFMRMINQDFKSLLVNCAGINRKVQKRVCYANPVF